MTGQQQQKQYKVTRDFTDSKGKVWKSGDQFTESDQQGINDALSSGNVQEDSSGQQGQQSGQSSGQTGQSGQSSGQPGQSRR